MRNSDRLRGGTSCPSPFLVRVSISANSMTSPKTQISKITIRVSADQFAVLWPCTDDLVPMVAPALSCRLMIHRAGGQRGYEALSDHCDFCRRTEERLYFAAGLLSRVIGQLSEHGYETSVEYQASDRPSLTPCREYLQGLSARERRRLRPLVKKPIGQIEVSGEHDAVSIVAHVAQLYPTATIDICVATRAVAVACHRALQDLLDERVSLHAGPPAQQRRVAVGLPRQIRRGEPRDILILLTAEQLTGTAVIDSLDTCGARYHRRYAIVSANRRPDEWRDLVLTAVTGPVISTCRWPRKGVTVVFVPAEGRRPQKTDTALGRKRAWYWRNSDRNKLIVDLARRFANKPKQLLAQLTGKRLELRQIAAAKKLKIAVLVESAEHARELARLLPTWRLETANQAARRGLPCNEDSPHAIVTETYAAKHRLQAQVIIRATGTPSPLRIRSFPPRLRRKEKDAHVLLIDFDDCFSPAALKCSARRHQQYVELGWTVLPISDIQDEPMRAN